MKTARSHVLRKMSLAWQIVVLLSVALLPIGGLAVFEAIRANERATSLAASELLAAARQAAEGERLEIAEGFGSAKTLGRNSAIHSGSPEECSVELANFISESQRYIFAAFIDTDGMMSCSSLGGVVRDYSEDETFLAQRAEPGRTVRVVESGNVTSRAVMLLSHPVYIGDVWAGTVTLSIPREVMGVFTFDDGEGDLNVALVDRQGRVLSRSAQESEESWWLPVGLADRFGEQSDVATVFEGVDAFGAVRTYARVPIFEGEVAGIFSQPSDSVAAGALLSVLRAILLPGLVWAICIGLAYFAMRRLVVTGIQRIQRSVVAFERGDRKRAMRSIPGASGELEALSSSFVAMARAVDAGERELSGLVEEKTVLLLEVYHRVKNNLQLIISIMNIQLRSAQDDRERIAIQTLRERVMGLALVHQRLYETPNLSSVAADRLVREIVSNLGDAKSSANDATIMTELDSFNLHPDQAVPFSLLVTEAMMNALKYSGHNGTHWRIDVLVTKRDDDRISLIMRNSVPTEVVREHLNSPPGGMGQPLMRAFVMQLGGAMTVSKTVNDYEMEVSFKLVALDQQGDVSLGMPGRKKAEQLAEQRASKKPAA